MYPYTQNTGTLIEVIKSIGKHGVPDKFTTRDLPVWGFKSSNDRPVIGVLKAIGFLDSSNAPQTLWIKARTDPEEAVAEGVRAAYADLFKTFPDAHRKDAEALTNFFKAKTTVANTTVKTMVSTFRALAQYGDFENVGDGTAQNEQADLQAKEDAAAVTTLTKSISGSTGLTVNLNIELSVPTDATGEVYEKFFAAMKKHLIDAAR